MSRALSAWVLGLGLFAGAAHAQERNFSIERQHLAVDRNGLLDVE